MHCFVGGGAFFNRAAASDWSHWRRAMTAGELLARAYAEAGGLMSYGTDSTTLIASRGIYVGRILKGEKPADLPVCNRPNSSSSSTARPRGRSASTSRRSLLARADEVIE